MDANQKQELDQIVQLLDIAIPFMKGEGVQRCPSCGFPLQLLKSPDWKNGVVCSGCEKVYSWVWLRQYNSEWKWNDGETALLRYSGAEPSPQIPFYCRRIGSYAFSNAATECLTLAGAVQVIESHAFDSNRHLKQIALPRELRRIEEGTFAGCDQLEEVLLPPGLTYIGKNAFSGCTALKRIHIPPSVCMIDTHAFSGSGLQEITLSGTALIGDHAFEKCEQLRTAQLTGVRQIRIGAFSGCSGLKRVTLGSGLLSIGEDAFRGCTGLSEVTLPAGVYEIGNHVFAGIPNVQVHADPSLREYVEQFENFCAPNDDSKIYLVEPTGRIHFDLEVKM